MVNVFFNKTYTTDVTTKARRGGFSRLVWFAGWVGITAVFALLMFMGGAQPSYIAWLIYLIGIVTIILRPRYGVYFIIFFSLAGDTILSDWYPFVKNFSSVESVLYLNNALIFSPLEFYIGLALIAWLGRALMFRDLHFYASELFWIALIFIGFICFGVIYGIGTGGNITIALWEARPIFYLPMMLILTNNLITEREHVHNVMWAAMLALFIEGINGSYNYFVKLNMDLSGVESITEHSAAIHLNTLIVFMLAVWLYRGSIPKRILLPLMVPPVLLTYLVTQRRAAYVALIIALVFMAFILFRESRMAFWFIVPPLMVVGLVYIAAFWNSNGAIAMPAQAVKSVIAEDEANEKDRRSNLYRQIENVNSNFTIRTKPLTGVGFGNKFYILVPMPDISFFEWWEYITHNSIVWIWMKSGVGGFVSMMMLIGFSVMVGVRALWRMPGGDLSAITLTATLYIIMHFIYAYVDMSWDSQSMVYVGAMMGLISCIERVVARPVAVPAKRWSWLPAPQKVPGLLPYPSPKTAVTPTHRPNR